MKTEKKKCKCNEDYDEIKKIMAYMDFATQLKMAQEDIKRQKQEKLNK